MIKKKLSAVIFVLGLVLMCTLRLGDILFKCLDCYAASGTLYETEPNNTASQADWTYDDYDNYGALSSSSDIDWWKVSYSKTGNANFWLGGIPTGCNYNLYLYNSDKTTLIGSSENTGNHSELFSHTVFAGATYYVKVVSFGGSSSNNYLFRTRNYPEVSLNRQYSSYSETYSYADELQYKMNCYGYAIEVCGETGTMSAPYFQIPGEFANDGETFNKLKQEYQEIHAFSTSNEYLNFIEGKVMADFNTLNESTYNEWTIIPTSYSADVPEGFRKIALVIDMGIDSHFYVRHTDGTWSHKRGQTEITNKSITSNVVITDSNINTVALEGGYSDGIRYYLICKSFIPDYRHGNGHGDNTVYTPQISSDLAGNVIFKAAKITSGLTKFGKFNYEDDIDFFEYIPITTKNYNITSSLVSSDYDVDITIYNHEGTIIASDSSIGNAYISITLTAGERYYIKIRDANHSVVTYMLYLNA
ncbi:MAG: hypothetical protein IKO30_05045 [Lachnospiraceae bacterium]|nr:hypothetical protein [Lachnospiraceae bacterium]